MQIPEDLDRDEVEVYRKQVEDMLNFCTDAAQQWADEGGRYTGQVPVGKAPARRMPFGQSHSSHVADKGTLDNDGTPATINEQSAKYAA